MFILETGLSGFQIVSFRDAALNLRWAENHYTGERHEEMETSSAGGGCGL
jgi:hypothetical protein